MNEYVEALKRHVAENPPNYGSEANSILEMLFTYYQIDCPEPFGQGQMGAVHDGVGRQGGLVTAVLTLIAAIALHRVMLPAATLGADESLGPLYLIQVVGTGFLCGEPLYKVAETQFLFLCHNSITS